MDPTNTSPDNTITILLAIITLIGTIATSAIAAYVAIQTNKNTTITRTTHDLVNGQTKALLDVTTAASRAIGVAAGAAGEQPQDAAAATTPPVPPAPTPSDQSGVNY